MFQEESQTIFIVYFTLPLLCSAVDMIQQKIAGLEIG